MTEHNVASETTVKVIDSDRVVRHLSRNFAQATRDMGKVVKGNQLYTYQVEFAHMIDEIQRGPTYLMPKVIADANELIASILLAKEAAKEAKK